MLISIFSLYLFKVFYRYFFTVSNPLTPAIIYSSNSGMYYDGAVALFGNGKGHVNLFGATYTSSINCKLAWNALLTWIVVLVSVLMWVVTTIIALTRKYKLLKFTAIFSWTTFILTPICGILLFFTIPILFSVNEWSDPSEWKLSATWVISAILLILIGTYRIINYIIRRRRIR